MNQGGTRIAKSYVWALQPLVTQDQKCLLQPLVENESRNPRLPDTPAPPRFEAVEPLGTSAAQNT